MFSHFLNHLNLAEVDAPFWSMTRSETEQMDPQQRLALEVVYECLQNSGTTDWKGKSIGSYFGIFGEASSALQSRFGAGAKLCGAGLGRLPRQRNTAPRSVSRHRLQRLCGGKQDIIRVWLQGSIVSVSHRCAASSLF